MWMCTAAQGAGNLPLCSTWRLGIWVLGWVACSSAVQSRAADCALLHLLNRCVQGMMACEQIMERIARHVGRPVHEVKALNMYQVTTQNRMRPLSALCIAVKCKRLAGLRPDPAAAASSELAGTCDRITQPELLPAMHAPSPLPFMPFLQEGDVAPFGQRLDGCQARRCWEEVLASSGFEQRLEAVQQHNAGGWRSCAVWYTSAS